MKKFLTKLFADENDSVTNIYSKYYELKRNKLEIKLLKNELKEKNLL